MPNYTPYFGLPFFNVGENFAELNNVQAEMERFVIIDSQLFGLYSIFGNGVVSGWNVTVPSTQNSQSLSVNVSGGIGVINLTGVQTQFQSTVTQLPPSSTVYIFATITGLSSNTSVVNFYYSLSAAQGNSNIVLAVVTTGATSIQSIDNTVRSSISFNAIIQALIQEHKHRGSPTKIDLALETKNQLPGYKIANLSASQITSGQLSPSVIPQIDHNSLLNRGILTHAQLDSFVASLSSQSQTMGQISLANQLRNLLYNKSKDPNYDSSWVNSFCYIPGLTSALDSKIVDISDTTANFSPSTGCISGFPVENTKASSVQWNSQSALLDYSSSLNVTVNNNTVSLSQSNLNTFIVEGFEEAQNGDPLYNFTVTLLASNNSTSVTADSNAGMFTQGNSSGDFHVSETADALFTEVLPTPQNWSNYQTLNISVKSISNNHGAVYFYFIDSVGGQSSQFQVLAQNEVTSNSSDNNFQTVSFPISSYVRSNVTTIAFVATNTSSNSDFWIGSVSLTSSDTYYPTGYIRYQFESAVPVSFNTINWSANIPTGTSVFVRAGVADSVSSLSSALFGPYLPNAASFTLFGQAIEVEVDLQSDSTFSFTPTLESLSLGLLSSSETNGLSLENISDWNQGTSQNILLTGNSSSALLSIQPIGSQATGATDTSYMISNVVNEVNSNNVPLIAISGNGLPVSEYQSWASLNKLPFTYGINGAKSCVRTSDRRWIVCDTGNSRIIIYGIDGEGKPIIQNIYAGQNQAADVSSTYKVSPLTATYNSQTGTLWLGFSQNVTIPVSNLNFIQISVNGQIITLSEESLLLTSSNLTGIVIPIVLSPDHQYLLTGNPVVYVTYSAAVCTNFNPTSLNSPIYINYAPISYFPFIWNPVYAVFSNDGSGNLWIANGTMLAYVLNSTGTKYIPAIIPPTNNLQLLNPSIGTIASTNSVSFSVEFGGCILELPNGNIMSAGMDSTYTGRLWSNSMISSPTILYTSPTNSGPSSVVISSDGNSYWVAESSGTQNGGRIIQIDNNGDILNIFEGGYTIINSIQALNNNNLLISV